MDVGLTITADTAGEARDALRDILLMYVDMADSYGGFGHATALAVRFDPLKFVGADLIDGPEGELGIDLAFLRTGSAIALLCRLFDEWCETDQITLDGAGQRAFQALAAGRLRHVPDVEAVVRECFDRAGHAPDSVWLKTRVAPIYERHVRGFFLRMAHRRG